MTTTTPTTVDSYRVITAGGTASSYRDCSPSFVANRDRDGVLSGILVLVSWGGRGDREGSIGGASVAGSYTVDDLIEPTGDGYAALLAAIAEADLEALGRLIHDATYANTEYTGDNCIEVVDYEGVRSDVAYTLGAEPHGIPATRQEAVEWRSHFVDEDIVEIVPVDTTTPSTIVSYDVITAGATADSYRDRDNAQIVAYRRSNGVLTGIEVVVSWAGHEGRAAIDGDYTLRALAESGYSGIDGLLLSIADADVDALASLIREATSAHTKAVAHGMGVVDFDAVRAYVAAAIGEEPSPRIPTTREEARGWRASFGEEDFIGFVPA